MFETYTVSQCNKKTCMSLGSHVAFSTSSVQVVFWALYRTRHAKIHACGGFDGNQTCAGGCRGCQSAESACAEGGTGCGGCGKLDLEANSQPNAKTCQPAKAPGPRPMSHLGARQTQSQNQALQVCAQRSVQYVRSQKHMELRQRLSLGHHLERKYHP